MTTQQFLTRTTDANSAALLRAVTGAGLDAHPRRMAWAVQILKADPAPRPSRRGGVLIAAYDADRRRRGARKGRGA